MCDPAGTPGNAPEKPEQRLLQVQRRQVLGALMDGITHDFKNILTAIIAGLELALADRTLTPPLQERLSMVLAAAWRMTEFNTRLQRFGRSSESAPAWVNLANLADETLCLLKPVLGHRFEVRVLPPPADLWPTRANTGQLIQVVLNLCLHVRDSLPGGAKIEVRLANERVAADRGEFPNRDGEFAVLILTVIGAELAPDLWRGFRPLLDPASRPPPQDWGISASQQIVEKHGGWIEATAGSDSVNQVRLFLPRAAGKRASRPGTLAAPDEPGLDAAFNGRESILIVDSDRSARWMLRAILAYRGYTVLEAAQGEEAIHLGEQAEGKVDLVMLMADVPDVTKPGLGERIQRANPRARIIVVNDPPPATPTFVGGSETFVLSRPFSNEAVLRLVRQTLDAVRERRPS